MIAVLIGGPRHLDQIGLPDAEQPYRMTVPETLYTYAWLCESATYRRTYPDHAGYAIYVCEDS